jgi:hypothetical protein
MITLQDYEPKITATLDEVLPRFAAEHPTIRVTAIALYCCPWTGTLSLCLNDTDTATEHEENCPDFEYVGYEEISFDEWQQEYLSKTPKVKLSALHTYEHDHDGDGGDEAFNEPFFKFLVDLAQEYFKPGRSKIRATWIGVQMLDSRLVKFWKM